jgi:hypothetical protein
MGFFPDRVSGTICLSWLPTMIFLISASWEARITDVSYWYPAPRLLFLKIFGLFIVV